MKRCTICGSVFDPSYAFVENCRYCGTISASVDQITGALLVGVSRMLNEFEGFIITLLNTEEKTPDD